MAAGEVERGIVLGGSGNGEAMVANRVRGVRCALCWNEESARLAAQHNDANMISLGQRMMPLETALELVKIWLDTPFEGGRHVRRIQMIDEPSTALRELRLRSGTRWAWTGCGRTRSSRPTRPSGSAARPTSSMSRVAPTSWRGPWPPPGSTGCRSSSWASGPTSWSATAVSGGW